MNRFRFGRSVRELRERRRWRQEDLAKRAGLSRSAVGRIERGEIGHMPYDRLVAVATALDGQLDLDFRWRGEAMDRLIDERHAAIVSELVALYRGARWEVAVEVTFSEFGERGSIDVFAWHPVVLVVAVNEVKASVGEAGGTVIGVDRKSRLAPQIAKQRGWSCRGVARFLVIADGSTSRGRIARHADIFQTAFPTGGRESLAWIRDPTVSAPPSGIVFLSPRNVHGARTKRRHEPSAPRAERDHARIRQPATAEVPRCPPDEHSGTRCSGRSTG
jgi:transcriptional regulator with XRE-family HTH domain